MPKKIDYPEQELKTIQLLLAGLLLKEEPRPDVGKLENLIHVRKGTLSEIFPQRKAKKSTKSSAHSATGGESNAK